MDVHGLRCPTVHAETDWQLTKDLLALTATQVSSRHYGWDHQWGQGAWQHCRDLMTSCGRARAAADQARLEEERAACRKYAQQMAIIPSIVQHELGLPLCQVHELFAHGGTKQLRKMVPTLRGDGLSKATERACVMSARLWQHHRHLAIDLRSEGWLASNDPQGSLDAWAEIIYLFENHHEYERIVKAVICVRVTRRS